MREILSHVSWKHPVIWCRCRVLVSSQWDSKTPNKTDLSVEIACSSGNGDGVQHDGIHQVLGGRGNPCKAQSVSLQWVCCRVPFPFPRSARSSPFRSGTCLASRLCKAAMFSRFRMLAREAGRAELLQFPTYHEAKVSWHGERDHFCSVCACAYYMLVVENSDPSE